MQTIKVFMLEGKDYFTEQEAAHYLGVGETKFKEIKKITGLAPQKAFGKNLYRRADLKRLIEDAQLYADMER